MKIRIAPPALQEAVQLAAGVAPARATIPALNCIRLHAGGGELSVTATDMDLGIRLRLPCTVEAEGSLAVPAARFAQLVREIPDPESEISSDGNLGLVRTTDGLVRLVGIDPADFPEFPAAENAQERSIRARDLQAMVARTAFAVSTETVRYSLTGLLLEFREGETRMVASDGRRMSTVTKPSRSGAGPRAIVPARALALVSRAVSAADEEIRVSIEPAAVRFETGRVLVFSRLIDGTFPDYDAVIPRDNPRRIRVKAEALRSGLRRTSLVTRDQSPAVRFTFAPGRVQLFARSEDHGEATVEIPAEYDGERFDVVFNPEYLLDYLRTVSEEEVDIGLRDSQRAALFQSSPEHLYVLMPLSVDLP